MFKKTRVRIVMSIMTILVLLLVGTLCLIGITSYMDSYDRNQQLLERYVQSYSQREGLARSSRPRWEGFDGEARRQNEIFWLSTFYSVAFSKDGGVIRVDDVDNIYSQEQLIGLASSVVERGREHGTMGGLAYRLSIADDYTLVAFVDNTIVEDRQSALFQYTLIFGSIAILVIFFISIWLSKRIVQPIEESYEKQKQFISDAGHELKTPVSVVGTNAELLEREIGENRWLSNIQYENSKMAALIRQLMELARTESVAANRELVDLSRVVMGELLTFESIAFDRGMELTGDLVAEDVFVYGDPERLRQMVSILLDNAIEHSTAQGTVTVSLSAARGRARLSVTNEGEEIPEGQRGLIFERFYRGDPSRTGDGGHYGLGLAIARSIVTAHHGEIQVSCGQGLVTFSVSLPVRRA